MFKKVMFVSLSLFLFLSAISPVFAEEATAAGDKGDSVLGNWFTPENKAKIQLFKCGDNFCGKIIWLKDPLNDEGTPKVDGKNPDKALQTRPIVGMNLVWGFTYEGGNKFKNGKIYNPENGKTYSCQMTLNGNSLDVRGYILGMTFLGETQTWVRAN